MSYIKQPIEKYIQDLAAKLPAPGGGSAASLVGALGISLLEMVANYTIGKEKYKQYEKDMQRLLGSCGELRATLTKAIDEDVEAYKKLSSVYKIGEKSAVQGALIEAVGVPLEVCGACHKGMLLAPELLEKGNINLISDVGVAASLLSAGFESALHNVAVNLRQIDDKDFVVRVSQILEPQKLEVEVTKEKITNGVNQKLKTMENK